jgi:hypothetical protein
VFDAARASYEISSLEPSIVKLAMTNIRSVMGAMDLDQILSHRDEITERLLRVVDAAVSAWGIKVLKPNLSLEAPSRIPFLLKKRVLSWRVISSEPAAQASVSTTMAVKSSRRCKMLKPTQPL